MYNDLIQSPVEVNLEVYKGDTFVATYLIQDANNAPFPLDNVSASLWCVSKKELAYVASTENGHLRIDAHNGLVILTIDGRVSDQWDFTSAKYDLELTFAPPAGSEASPLVITIALGSLAVIKDITNNARYQL